MRLRTVRTRARWGMWTPSGGGTSRTGRPAPSTPRLRPPPWSTTTWCTPLPPQPPPCPGAPPTSPTGRPLRPPPVWCPAPVTWATVTTGDCNLLEPYDRSPDGYNNRINNNFALCSTVTSTGSRCPSRSSEVVSAMSTLSTRHQLASLSRQRRGVAQSRHRRRGSVCQCKHTSGHQTGEGGYKYLQLCSIKSVSHLTSVTSS